MRSPPEGRIAAVLLGSGICLLILVAPVLPPTAPHPPAFVPGVLARGIPWALKLLLISLPCLATAFLFLQSYLKTGSASLLCFSIGLPAIAFTHGAAVWPGSLLALSETGVSACSTAFFLAALFLLLGAANALLPRIATVGRRRLPGLALVLVGIGTGFSLLYEIPPFGFRSFIAGRSSPFPWQIAVSSTILLFWMVAALLLQLHRNIRPRFLFWQAWGLVYFASGLGGFFPAGDGYLLPGWAGQYIQATGGFLFWAALLSVMAYAFRVKVPPAKILTDIFTDTVPHHRAVVESLSDAVISCDAEGRVIMWNSAAKVMFDDTAAGMAGKGIGSLLGNRVMHLFPAGRKAESAAFSARLELEGKRKSGAALPLEVSISRSPSIQGWITTFVMRDITERVTSARALEQLLIKDRDQKEFFEKLMAILPIGIAVVAGEEHRYEYVNPYYKAIPGNSATMMVGKPIAEVFPHESMQKTIDTIETVYRSAQVVSIRDYQACVGPGRERTYWNADFIPLIGNQGVTEAVMIITQEITAEKCARDALKKSYRELEQRILERTAELLVANQALKEEIAERQKTAEALKFYTEKLEWSNRELQDFAFAASHDLQEPLRKIQAFGDRLQNKYAAVLDPNGRDYLSRMQNAAGRMQLLIQDLLEYSRITTRARPFVQVDLNQVIQQVLADLEFRIEQTGGQMEIGTLTCLDADPPQMHRLFQNLIANALKFRQNASPIIGIQGHPISPPPDLDGHPRAKWYQVSVSDNGIGFDEKYAERIFAPFQRLHGRTEFEGTGMGLAICRKIVQRHGGEIFAHSTMGKGSTFIINLPVHQPVKN